MNPLRRLAAAIGHAFLRPWLRRRLGRTVIEEIDGVSLVVLPEVFNPKVFRSGTLLAQTLANAEEFDPPAPNPRALDLGTGSGVGAVFAARRGYQVVAVDINEEAVRCARINALAHALENDIEIRHGDLFGPVNDETFDLVIFNPPYFEGEPRNALDAAWRSKDVLERFADGLCDRLTSRGRGLLVLSTDGDGDLLVERLRENGFIIGVAGRRAFGNEILTAWSLERPESSP